PPPAPGLADVAGLAATAEAAGVRVEVSWHGTRRPAPPDTGLAAFRVVQESLTNAVRHSGADSCRVRVDYLADALAIEIADEGPGAGSATGSGSRAGDGGTGGGSGVGYGLTGMAERVALLGGTFTAGPRPHGGFLVTARLPLPAATGESAR
ncbi:ATP-binding protein, partial [Streptomyces sp. SID11385]|uniref:sensor histidine kinase n=1 Tax=Streptomyces sp. SID11385 TaxID=2706031 RepID=UPI0013C621F6